MVGKTPSCGQLEENKDQHAAELPNDTEHLVRSPSFQNPPVVEVAIGLEFLPVPALGPVNLVALHGLWKSSYPKISEQPALKPSYGRDMSASSLGIEFIAGVPPIRIWMLTTDENHLLQVQNDRLILNWRRDGLSSAKYPRYKNLRSEFFRRWQEFSKDIDKRNLGAIQPMMAEVTYVNYLEIDDGKTLADALTPLSEEFSSKLITDTSIRLSVALKDNNDTIIGHKIATAASEGAPDGYANLTIVTRIAIEGDLPEAAFSALDLAHKHCANYFVDITTPRRHEAWGRLT